MATLGGRVASCALTAGKRPAVQCRVVAPPVATLASAVDSITRAEALALVSKLDQLDSMLMEAELRASAQPKVDQVEAAPRRASPSSKRLQRIRSEAHAMRSTLDNAALSPSGHRLTREEELACCQAIQAVSQPGGSDDPMICQAAARAQARLVQAFQRFITSQAYIMQRQVDVSRKVPYYDIFLSGVLGLVEAARRYKVVPTQDHRTATHDDHAAQRGASGVTATSEEHDQHQPQQTHNDPQHLEAMRNVRFLTFAQFYIRKHMRQTIKDNDDNDVYVPQPLIDIRTKAARVALELKAEGRTRVRVSEVAARMGVRATAVSDLTHAMRLTVSPMEETAGEEDEAGLGAAWRMDGGGAAGNVASSEADQGAGQRLAVPSLTAGVTDRVLRSRSLRALLSDLLDPRELYVLWRTMGLSGREGPVSHSQLGRDMGITRQRVTQLEERALGKLRRACVERSSVMAGFNEICTLA